MNTDLVTEKIIGCGMKVSNTLGIGFLERVYENALAFELRKSGLRVEQQKCISVLYEGVVVVEKEYPHGPFDATGAFVSEIPITPERLQSALENSNHR